MNINQAPLISVAPMLDWTDRHCRYFLRLFHPNAMLYTEMITTGALLHNPNSDQFLRFAKQEQPLALQLGGSCPDELASCTERANAAGFREINLNVGCPSNRVQKGRFGACLMKEPELVAQCVSQMQQVSDVPITVKTRIGIDEQHEYAVFLGFIQTLAQAGCRKVIIHARNAWLEGLSPKENRHIPPLCYDWVYQLKSDLPQLTVIMNGGIQSLDEVKQHQNQVDGVMIGRAAYHDPYLLARLAQYFEGKEIPSPHDIIQAYLPYVKEQLAEGVPLKQLTKPIFGLLQYQKGAKRWRRYLSEHSHLSNADEFVIKKALAQALNHSTVTY